MDFEARVRRELQIILGFEESSLNTNQKTNESRTSGLSVEDYAALAETRESVSAASTYQTSISKGPELLLSIRDDLPAQTEANLLQSRLNSLIPISDYSSSPTTGAHPGINSDTWIGRTHTISPPLSVKSYQPGGSHYRKYQIQPIEYIVANSLSFLAGNVIKYATRYKDKNGAEDIRKAIHYLNMILEFEYKNEKPTP